MTKLDDPKVADTAPLPNTGRTPVTGSSASTAAEKVADAITTVIHFVAPRSVRLNSRAAIATAVDWGTEVIVSDDLIDANRDRHGQPPAWWELLDDEAAQRERYGHVVARRGAWPEGVDRTPPGSDGWEQARQRARAAAFELPEAEQQPALAKVRQRYGMPSSSRTFSTYGEQ